MSSSNEEGLYQDHENNEPSDDVSSEFIPENIQKFAQMIAEIVIEEMDKRQKKKKTKGKKTKGKDGKNKKKNKTKKK